MRFRATIRLEGKTATGIPVSAGETVDVDDELDTEPRTVDAPDDLAQALSAAGVREAIDASSYSERRRIVLAVEGARSRRRGGVASTAPSRT